MIKIAIKGLTVNQAYQGRRFSTPALKEYKKAIYYLCPVFVPPEGNLSVTYEFGVSNKNSDGDNLIKAFQDALAEKYNFNDNRIYEWVIRKIIVPKGKEYVAFDIQKAK